jgi:hypothetical protein
MKLYLLQRLYKGSGDGQSEAATWQWRNTWQNSRYHNLTTIRTVNLPHMRPGRYSYVDLFRLVFSATEVGGTAWHAAGVLIRHDTHKGSVGRIALSGARSFRSGLIRVWNYQQPTPPSVGNKVSSCTLRAAYTPLLLLVLWWWWG